MELLMHDEKFLISMGFIAVAVLWRFRVVVGWLLLVVLVGTAAYNVADRAYHRRHRRGERRWRH